MARFLYFAYGSNMLTERLIAAKRCPSARPLAAAYVDGYALEFSKKSSKDGSGKATLIPYDDRRQYGVLFEIDDRELDQLDHEEGVGKGYDRHDRFAVIRADTGETVPAKTYLATKPRPDLRPFDWYLALIVAGARQHGLPQDQIERLRSSPYHIDLRDDRPRRHDAIDALRAAGQGMPGEVLAEIRSVVD